MNSKVKGTLIFTGIIAILFIFDFARSRLFTISLVEVTPNPIHADGATPVTVRARVTRGGKGVAGHDLFIVSHYGGNFVPYRVASDENGEVVYTYYPYKANSLIPLKDVLMEITDQSNSVFMEVNAKARFVIPAVESQGGVETVTIESIWGQDN
jgi:hypothetical protein